MASGWDLAVGSYASKSLSVTSEENAPVGLAFSSDGTKAYVVGTTNDTVYQYTLSTAWDISTGSYASKSMSVASQETGPYGLAFSSDGTKAYVVGEVNDTVYQYTLSTAWDISTGSYASKSMSVATQAAAPRGLAFSSDGTKCYVVDESSKYVYQYTLSTAWDISTGSYASKSLSVTSQDIFPEGVSFSSDGTKAFVVGYNNKTVYQYTLSTAWDISTGSYASKSMSVTSEDTAPGGLAFSSDGTKAYVVGNANDTVYQYVTGTYEMSGTVKDPSGTAIANAEVTILQNISGDISTGVYASKSMSVTSEDTNPREVIFSDDGTKAYVAGVTNKTIYQYTLSTAWDISTGSYASKSLSVTSQDTTPQGLAFSSDGTKCYVVGATNNAVYQYTLSTAWDISTGSYASKSMSVSTQETNPQDLAFSSDGTKAYVVGTASDTVYQYTLSTAWDISTGSYASKSMPVTSQDINPVGLAFSSDGTKAYVAGWSNKTIYQYSLSTAWDISSGSYASKSLSVTSQESTPTGITLSPNGSKCYTLGYTNDTVYQYDLSTVIEKASLTADGSGVYTYTSAAVETDLQAVAHSPSGTRRFGASDNNLATA